MKNLLPLIYFGAASAFVAPSKPTKRLSVGNFGISEWRDALEVSEDGVQVAESPDEPSVRSIPLLPVDSSKVVLQGETLHLQLFEDDEVRLFQQALDHHGGIFGMGLMSTDTEDDSDVLLDTMPLVEIQDYNMMGGNFGIFCKAKVVGRAAVIDVIQQSEDSDHMSALCTERFDRYDSTSNIELANNVATMCENLIADVSGIEQSCGQNGASDLGDETSRLERYQAAYQAALESDKQGYLLPSSSVLEEQDQRSWREINAVSWAVFSTSKRSADDGTFRLSALDMDTVLNRLKLAMYWLSDVRLEVAQAVN